MNLDKITGTLYDLLGYVLPGYIVLVALSLAESTFGSSRLLSLGALARNVAPATVAAYYLGHLALFSTSLLRGHRFTRPWVKNKKNRLGEVLDLRVKETLADVYDFPLERVQEMKSMETFLLVDSYVVAAGGSCDREVLMAREGFFKASLAAFLFLALPLIAALFRDGAAVRLDGEAMYRLSKSGTAALAIAVLLMAAICRSRYLFFNAVKITHTETVFLALVQKEKGTKSAV